ncbi:MAG: alanine--tRNA ligase, partial [Candidatus Marinimicrobia bacterium]|nr:alanine--tRNA ligase [Candidatus Neomarinimicrobiota bacterium]
TVSCEVNIQKRSNVKRNHTATHLLHKALKVVLGNHVNQAGSLVESDYLRFDLTHFKKITDSELNKIEIIINDKILENIQLESSVTSFDDAKNQGAEALFGEKYGDEVRVVQVSDFSKELCGGTHVSSTGDIGSFKIKEEASLSSGVRRIVAITGKKSVLEMQKNEQTIKKLQTILNSTSVDLVFRVEQLLSEKKEIDKKLKENLKNNLSYDFTQKYKTINNYKVIIEKITEFEGENIKMIGDQVYNQLKSGIGIVFVESNTKPAAVIIVSKDLNKIGVSAGKLAKDIGRFMGGGGGGKPHLATAGGKEGLSFDKVLEKSEKYIKNLLKG